MKVFITGASGFVGAATVRAALEAGHEVVAPVRADSRATRLLPLSGLFTRLELDLDDGDSVRAAMALHRPDSVIHLAWSGVARSGNSVRSERSQISENVDSACALTEAAAAEGVADFVSIGSQSEYGLNPGLCEASLPAPRNLYGAAKVATMFLTRQIAHQSGMRYAWVRLFPTYGPDDNEGRLIPTLITEMLAGRRPRTTRGTQSWDYLHVDDAARGILSVVAEQTAEGIFNIGSGCAVLVRHVVELVRDLAAPGMELRFGELPFADDQVMRMRADISRIHAVTGWEPRIPLEEGLAETVDWYRRRLV